ncbi:putative sodium-dependent excitatory amino acid transporter glt-6 [Echinococcus granulosus]|nr:putative sodium-dependent excitatory amino acid transporter glt-6 [Echinococcus granulosus]KAH9287233.1 putative sodium-dependent excitatory amino acid transporter glt-6 [Echinococcus granulosus]
MADSKLPAEEAVYDDEDETVVSERKKRKGFVGCLINNWFMVTTIIGVIIGFGAGLGIHKAGVGETGKTWLAMPGTIYIRLLKLTILPMISANIINVMANLNPKENGKVSAIALGFILVFNLLSALIGVAYSYIINPGKVITQTPGNGSTSQSNLTSAGNQISYIFKDLLFVVCLPKAFIACDKYGIPQRISRFVLPLAGTMKSDASAVFIAASCLFVAQQANVELDAGKVVIVIDRLRSGNIALSHIYCAAFTYHATANDVVEEEGEGDLEAYEWSEVDEKK